jgi:hypothetical protein
MVRERSRVEAGAASFLAQRPYFALKVLNLILRLTGIYRAFGIFQDLL